MSLNWRPSGSNRKQAGIVPRCVPKNETPEEQQARMAAVSGNTEATPPAKAKRKGSNTKS